MQRRLQIKEKLPTLHLVEMIAHGDEVFGRRTAINLHEIGHCPQFFKADRFSRLGEQG